MPEVSADSIGVSLLQELVWEDFITLRPGVDHHDGITYMTIPTKRNVERQKRVGKKTETVVERENVLAVITSDGRDFAYDTENVEKLGFVMPKHVTIETTKRWSTTSIIDFIGGRAKSPDPATLHKGIKAVYEEYIEFARPEFYDILPLFVMGTYMYRLFKSIGYLHFNGTAASGKSQNLRILEALSLNAVWASSMSAAALYRQVAGFPGLIILDEAEGFEGERGEELRRILNAGYLDGQEVKRAEKAANDTFQTVGFDTYGPKAIASIAPLDYVIGSRCLIVAMRPAIRTIPEFDKDDPRWARLRDRLYLWTMFHSAAVGELVEEWNRRTRSERAPQLLGRQWQITQSYIVLADYIDRTDGGDRCDRLIAFFNSYFADLQQAQDATDRIRIVLRCLPRVLAIQAPDDGGYFYLKSIHEVVSGYLEDDAKEYYKTRSLSKHLDVLGFKTKRSKKQGTQIWLDPTQIREEFRQRRIEPYPEDIEWLAGEVEYTHNGITTVAPEDTHSMWALLADEETNGTG